MKSGIFPGSLLTARRIFMRPWRLAAGAPLDKCGVLGSRISSEVVKVFGSVLGREAWDKVFEDIKGL